MITRLGSFLIIANSKPFAKTNNNILDIFDKRMDFQILEPTDTEPSVEQIQQMLTAFNTTSKYSAGYLEFSSAVFEHVMLRKSRVPRRYPQKTLDYDIVRITVNEQYRRQGFATRFFKNLMIAAEKDGRGVFLEQCITPDSQSLARSLVDKGFVTEWGFEMGGEYFNFLSYYPVPKEGVIRKMKYIDFIAALKKKGYSIIRDSAHDYIETGGYEITLGIAYIYSDPEKEIDLSKGRIGVGWGSVKMYEYQSFDELCELLDKHGAKKKKMIS